MVIFEENFKQNIFEKCKMKSFKFSFLDIAYVENNFEEWENS